jgi:hypothetical protein
MNKLTVSAAPVELIGSVVFAKEPYLIHDFMFYINKLYQYDLFKPFLDLCATLVQEGRLEFKLTPKEVYHLDEGTCLTINEGAFDKLRNRFANKKRYVITVRQIASDVIIHEIGHLVEQEADLILSQELDYAIVKDLREGDFWNLSLKSAVEQVMVREVAGYGRDHWLSEKFTRFFQLLAMAMEISGKKSAYGYKVEDFLNAFPATNAYMRSAVFKVIERKINPQIASVSRQYIKDVENIKHAWAQDKVKSFHKTTESSKWSKTIKSIKD